MPGPGPGESGLAAALRSLQEQINRLARRLIDLAHLDQSGAADGQVPVWNDTAKVWEAGTPPAGASLWVGPSAPTDGSKFWYDTDATC